MPENSKEPAPKLAKGVVATGRTVALPSGEKRVVGHTAEGKPVFHSVERQAGPGEEIELPVAEIEHLRQTGFLFDPAAAVAARGNGPSFERR